MLFQHCIVTNRQSVLIKQYQTLYNMFNLKQVGKKKSLQSTGFVLLLCLLEHSALLFINQ